MEVGLAVADAEGEGELIAVKVKTSDPQASGTAAALGLLSGAVGATASCLNW